MTAPAWYCVLDSGGPKDDADVDIFKLEWPSRNSALAIAGVVCDVGVDDGVIRVFCPAPGGGSAIEAHTRLTRTLSS